MNIDQPLTGHAVTLSVIVPVYNHSQALRAAVQSLESFRKCTFEIVLVNDGSTDDTAAICTQLAEEFSNITVIHLSRTFGTDNAVLAGLRHLTGQYVAVTDGLGQPGMEHLDLMLDEMRRHNCDVVYGAAISANQTPLKRIRTRITNRLATVLLQKPQGISLSRFKVINRFVVDEILKYKGPFPFIDGLIYRSTSNIRQVALNHIETDTARLDSSRSQRTGRWLNMFLNFSVIPLRLSAYVGLAAAIFSVFALVLIWIDKIYFAKNLTPGIRTALAVISLFSGIQLMLLGVVGEYLGRLFLDQTGTPQSIVRYIRRGR